MTNHRRLTALAWEARTQEISVLLAVAAIGASAWVTLSLAEPLWRSLGAGLTALAAATILSLVFAGRHLSWSEVFQDFGLVAWLALVVDPGKPIWQVPRFWADLFLLNDISAALIISAYLLVLGTSLARSGRHPPPAAASGLLVLPWLFHWVLIAASPQLFTQLQGWIGAWWTLPPWGEAILTRMAILLVLNEILVCGLFWLLRGRLLGSPAVHALLLLCALFAGLSPPLADLGAMAVSLWHPPPATAIGLSLLAAALACLGLWAETYVLTGFVLDALHQRSPSRYWGWEHLRQGVARGTLYSLVFMGVVQLVALFRFSPAWDWLTANPLWGAAALGALVFPLVKTIVESFDGSAPFLMRLRLSLRHPRTYGRGLLLGLGLGLAWQWNLAGEGSWLRSSFGFVLGAAVYALVDLLADTQAILRQRRRHLQTPRLYWVGALLGGVTGMAIAWYLDTMQLAALAGKFARYASVSYLQDGLAPLDYVVRPLFSKWGAMALGEVGSGARLLFNESLEGVINWSLAAPLFGINLVLLTALVQRSRRPLQGLFSRQGMVGVVEQTIRVLRWGLWMAPIIFSFLRIAPEPSWYNQDGALRTLIASFQATTLEPGAFADWSLHVFVALLAYDWLRILIWFDHMGLRVATLVNLSFVGGDRLDEAVARYFGHPGRTRVIPEGLRRFATWAPLLIPFYLPRGGDWDAAWQQAEALAKLPGAADLPPFLIALLALLFLGGGSLLLLGVFRRRLRTLAAAPSRAPGQIPPPQRLCHQLSNGLFALQLFDDGRGCCRVFSRVRMGQELDLTRRADGPTELLGPFFYLTDLDVAPGPGGRSWSIGQAPMHRVGPDYAMERLDRARLGFGHGWRRIDARAEVSLTGEDPACLWTLRLRNLDDRPRRLWLTSYRELALNLPDVYQRHSSYNKLHLGTRFVAALGAILAQNRKLKHPASGRDSGETYVHAFGFAPEAGVRLIGYQDCRAAFLGGGTLAAPAALDQDLRALDDEGLLYSFDPIASLRLEVALAPGALVEIRCLDGYAVGDDGVLDLLRRRLGRSGLDLELLRAVNRQTRSLPGFGDQTTASEVQYSFTSDGQELELGIDTPQPWSHMLANPLGFGVILNNDGACYSFMGNSQQNGLTPFSFDAPTTQNPGQAIYLLDLDSGERYSPTLVPLRDQQTTHGLSYGLGHARFRAVKGPLELELVLFVPPDAPVQVQWLRLRNSSQSARRLRLVTFAQMVLAGIPGASRGHLKLGHNTHLKALLFENPDNEFWGGTAFVASSLPSVVMETGLHRFIGGTDRDLSRPAMLEHGRGDPAQPEDGFACAAFAATLSVPAGGERQLSLVLGQVARVDQTGLFIRRFTDLGLVAQSFEQTRAWWSKTLSVLTIETDAPDFDRLVNTWLPYQILVARLWGRAGPNQRSGGYGFRDQLQDVLPFCLLDPALARRQILLHAAQQFPEGDVLAWWHPNRDGRTGLGARLRASDPHLWLPYVVCRYVQATGDKSLLQERLPFLEGVAIPPGEEGVVFTPRPSREEADLYEHCRRAIEFSLARLGRHGLPLMGAGDWNDGLSRIGAAGRGESLWLGCFLYDILQRFTHLTELKPGTAEAARRYREAAMALWESVRAGWRRDRFLRAFDDTGREMVLADALTAAWPILADMVDLELGGIAMETALAELVEDGLVRLLAPAFTQDSTPPPGRIADYPPGVRENGGQYSHGVSWLVEAQVKLAEWAAADGRTEEAERHQVQAWELWRRISPLGHGSPERLQRYGLPPHQQAADVYDGPGYAGRGGWSWYTGAAARMLSAAYALLGIELRGGKLNLRPVSSRSGGIRLRRLRFRGKEYYRAPEEESVGEGAPGTEGRL